MPNYTWTVNPHRFSWILIDSHKCNVYFHTKISSVWRFGSISKKIDESGLSVGIPMYLKKSLLIGAGGSILIWVTDYQSFHAIGNSMPPRAPLGDPLVASVVATSFALNVFSWIYYSLLIGNVPPGTTFSSSVSVLAKKWNQQNSMSPGAPWGPMGLPMRPWGKL